MHNIIYWVQTSQLKIAQHIDNRYTTINMSSRQEQQIEYIENKIIKQSNDTDKEAYKL